MKAPMLSKENPLFVLFCCHTALLVCKLLFASFSIMLNRLFRRVTPNPEDARFMRTKPSHHPVVERIRRAHLNALENIPAFIFVSFLYILTNPNFILASILFWAYTISRYTHFVAYAYFAVAPVRALSFITGLLITIFMSIRNYLLSSPVAWQK